MEPRRKHTHTYHPQQILHNMDHASFPLFIELLKKITPLALSFSLFSLLFLHPSWLPFSRLSTFSWQFLSHGADKNYIFLLCNGILVLVAKYSCWTFNTHPVPFSSSETTTPHDDDSLMFNDYALEPPKDISALEKDVVNEKDEQDEKEDQRSEEKEDELDGKVGQFLMITDGSQRGGEEDMTPHDHDQDQDDKDDYKEQIDEKSENGFYIKEEEEENDEEEGEVAKMSTEELNRKIEEFIRKMKEELRIEAQQQLIVV